MAKRGRLSLQDMDFIRRHMAEMSIDELAKELDRDVASIQKFLVRDSIKPIKAIDTTKPINQNEKMQEMVIQYELRNRPEWQQLKEEFSEDELKFFEARYGRLMKQFREREDIPCTEETQVLLLIKFEILMSRNLRDRKRANIDIEQLENLVEKTYSKYKNKEMENETKSLLLNIEQQLASNRAAQQSKTLEYIKLEEKHQGLMKDLKATREQRVKNIESSKHTYIGLIKMLQEREAMDREGRQVELMKMATKKEMDRLAQLHTYNNNTVDQPLLSSETIVDE